MRTIEIMNTDGTVQIGVVEVLKSGRYIGLTVRDESVQPLGDEQPIVELSVDVAEAARIIAALSAAIAEQYAEDEAARRAGE